MLILFSYQPPRARWCGSRGRRPRVFSEYFYLIVAILLAIAGALSGAPVEERAPPRLYIDYSAKPSPENLTAFDLCILDPGAEVDLEPGRALGNRYLAYVSVVEARAGSVNETAAQAGGIPFAGKNEAWGTRLMDVTHPAWPGMMMEKVVRPALAKGFDGIFLDTVDSVSLLGKAVPGHEKPARAAILGLVREIKKKHPDKTIVMNRGFELLPEARELLGGVLVESVYRTCDPKTRTYTAVSAESTAWLVARIGEARRMGLPVYAVDYVPATEKDLARTTAEKLAALGCVPFVTTIDLQGVALAPVCEVSRRVLVLFGWDAAEAERPVARPAATLTARALQAELEWMGYEVEYHDIGSQPPPRELPAHTAGVIVDAQMEPRADQEEALVRWLALRQREKTPLLFAGRLPWSGAAARAEFARHFGITGSTRPVYGASEPRVTALDGAVAGGASLIKARTLGFTDLQAPAGAKVFLSLSAKNRAGDSTRFDPVFLAPWGGAWLDPFVMQASPGGGAALSLDAVAFFKQWLDAGAFPAPDSTTRDGRRVFHSQLVGDGFAMPTHFPGHPTCAEVMRDRILSRYPLPVTVALAEEDVRGAPDAHGLAVRNENIARTIFAMPHLQAGIAWRGDGGKTAAPGGLASSTDFIERRLLTGGKQTEIVLDGGAQAADPAILRLRGGDGARVMGSSPRSLLWNDEIQFTAGPPDDRALTNSFEGPSYDGFTSVIGRFVSTGGPRRVAPVEVRCHFESAARLSSLRAVEDVYQWCLGQPLHPLTSREHAQIAADARRTKIFQLAPDRWLVANAGKMRTLRLDASAGAPDLARCTGVSGWRKDGNVLYVHTMGTPRVELVMSGLTRAPAAARPWLVESAADLHFHQLNDRRAVMDVRGWRPSEVVFGGLRPHGLCRVTAVKKTHDERADATGRLSLLLAPRTTVSLDFNPPSDVALH